MALSLASTKGDYGAERVNQHACLLLGNVSQMSNVAYGPIGFFFLKF